MPILLHINIGFVTNSSSMVYHFPRALLEDAQVQTFLKAFEIEDGFIGAELWARNECGTFAVTREQKVEVQKRLTTTDYGTPPSIDIEDDSSVVVIYGDEHRDIAAILSKLLEDTAQRLGIRHGVGGVEYN